MIVSRRQFLQITAVAGSLLAGGQVLRHLQRLQPVTVRQTRLLMGTVVNLALVVADEAEGEATIAATLAEMERLISLFDHRQPDSPLAILNREGVLLNAPPDLVDVVAHALTYGDITGGAFDISVKPLLDAYRIGGDGAVARPLVDYRQILVSGSDICLGHPGMALTLDGIAKGRVVDGATAVLRARGFENVLVEAGGDLAGYGARADGRSWRVGVTHPRTNDSLATLAVQAQAVATSGDYMNSFRTDFSLHHILDPATGHSPTALASVTVVAPTALDADALSTAVMVLGLDKGLALVQRLPHVEALLITKDLQSIQTDGFPAI